MWIKKLKNTIILLLILLFIVGCVTNETVDTKLAKSAEVILRVRCTEQGEGDKYHWQTVKIIKVLKNESDYTFKDILKVAHYSWEKGIPLGISTIYLERYNLSRNDLWKLMGGKAETGVSHHNK